MIVPLSSRPFHTIRYQCETLSDKITALFFRVISLFSHQFEKYYDYYERKADWRYFSLNTGNNLINSSLNWIHPKKIPDLTDNEPKGFCFGMCYDYVRRSKSLNIPFNEKILCLANKFERGANKKAYIIQSSFRRLTAKDNILQNSNRNALREKVINSIDFGLKIQQLKHALSPATHDKILNGDYFLFIEPKDRTNHVICLLKREEGTLMFDPALGSYFFKDPKELYRFIFSIAERMHQTNEIGYNLFSVE